MPFLKKISIDTGRVNPFPYNVMAIRYAKDIELSKKVTLFIGDNGCGKSTLLETLAVKLDLPLIGGFISDRAGFEAARILQPFTEIEFGWETKKGFFFRAEDFSDFINTVEHENRRIEADLHELRGEVKDSVIREMRDNMNHSLQNMRKTYGENMQAFSHGEAYLKILQTRIGDKGIYLLDEPEAALSPLKQLTLIFFITEVLKNKNTQFIISTHSPILMGIPGAMIYEINDSGMNRVAYEETEHYQITKGFLNHPEMYLGGE